MSDQATPGGDDEDRKRIFVVAVICAAILVGWYMVSYGGILDDVLPNAPEMWDF